MDLEFSPSILDTPSILNSSITTNPLMFKSSYVTQTTSDENNTSLTSNPSSITTTTATTETRNDESVSVSSAQIKLSNIEHHLKQSFTQPREPTESPFRKIAEAGVLSIGRNVSLPLTTDDGIPIEIPSTAEVMNVIESFSKNLMKDHIEREATAQTSENNRLDTSPTQPMGVIVSPKKKLLIRSQSHTEPTSPPLNHFSDEPAMEFQRLQDLPMMDSDVHPKPSFPNKRTFQQTLTSLAIPKANSILIPQHEVTSTGQLLNIKRQKTIPTSNIRSSTNDDYLAGDDQRKKQIRDSNREAARRCRERRRHYIEQLEGNLEQCKLQMKQLNEKLSRAERENTQLRAIITEAKIFHPSSRLSSNESLVDFANVISAANGIELSSEATEGNPLQRNFITRNTH